MATTNNVRTLTTASASKTMEPHSLERLKDALITVPIFLMLFIQSLLFELLDFFFEMKFESFPTIVLVAEPGSGKTPTVKAIYRPDETVQMFLTQRRFEKFILKCSGRILFDDFLDANSQAECQRLKLNYDMGVRYSFNGTVVPAVITMEADAVHLLNRSAKERIIPLFFGEGLNVHELSEKMTYIQSHQEELDELESILVNELPNILPTKDEYQAQLANYRRKYKDVAVNSKRTDMCFALHFAEKLLITAVTRNCGIPFLDPQQLEGLNHYALTSSFKCDTNNYSVLEDTLQQFIKHGVRPYIPAPTDICEEFVRNGCSRCSRGSGRFCKSDCAYDEVTAYNPEHLVLRYDDESNATLLPCPDNIYQYRYHNHKTPSILIMDSSIFLAEMNAELDARAATTNEAVTYFTAQKLHQDLAAINRCMKQPDGKHFRYALDYPCYASDSYDTARVIALLLKPEEVQYLQDHAVHRQYLPFIWECTQDSARIARTLRKTFSSLTCQPGSVGFDPKKRGTLL